jgi:ATP-dependent helicase/nuclease subunit B
MATTDTPAKNKLLTNEFVDFAQDHAIEALQRWINGEEPFTAKLHPDYNNYTDFDQLSRLAEWDGRQPIEGEESGDE